MHHEKGRILSSNLMPWSSKSNCRDIWIQTACDCMKLNFLFHIIGKTCSHMQFQCKIFMRLNCDHSTIFCILRDDLQLRFVCSAWVPHVVYIWWASTIASQLRKAATACFTRIGGLQVWSVCCWKEMKRRCLEMFMEMEIPGELTETSLEEQRRAEAPQSTEGHDRNAVPERVRFLHQVRGEQHRAAGPFWLQGSPQLVPCVQIHARGRFVEDNDLQQREKTCLGETFWGFVVLLVQMPFF